MALSETDICNSALVKLGVDTISALSDNTKAAKLCNARYAYARDTVLASHPWNFAKKRISLALDATTPAYYYTYRFIVPTDAIKLLDNDLDENSEWVLENGYILTFATTMNILYVFKQTDTTKFEPLFTEALAWWLASDLAYALVQSTALMQNCATMFKNVMAEARSKNAQERGSLLAVVADNWTQARVTSGSSLGLSDDPAKL